ncbi:MAG: hypothetical protein AB8F95_06220 [Bacteroidia bacterium]
MNTTSYVVRFSILLFILALFLSTSYAQVSWVTDATVQHHEKFRPGQTISLMAEPNDVKKAWKDFLKDRYDMDVEGLGFLTNKDILTAEKVMLPTMHDYTLDLYAEIVPTENKGIAKTQMTVFAAYGYDMYVDRHEHREAYKEMRAMFNAFLSDFVPAFYKEKIEDMSDGISDLEKDKIKLEEYNIKIEEDIEKSLAEIEKLKEDIENLKSEHKENIEEIDLLKIDLAKEKDKLEAVQDRYETKKPNPNR